MSSAEINEVFERKRRNSHSAGGEAKPCSAPSREKGGHRVGGYGVMTDIPILKK